MALPECYIEDHHYCEPQHEADRRQINIAAALGFGNKLFDDNEYHGAGCKTEGICQGKEQGKGSVNFIAMVSEALQRVQLLLLHNLGLEHDD